MPQVRISEVILVRVYSSENLFFRRLTYYSIMPRTKKGIGKKTSGHPTGQRQNPPGTNHHPVDDKCRNKRQEPHPRRDVPYHQNCHKTAECYSADPPLRCEVPTCSEDDLEEVDGTPLTRADTPKIVDAILSNFSTANLMGHSSVSSY